MQNVSKKNRVFSAQTSGAARLQITLAPSIMSRLEEFCNENGVKRSAVIAFALGKYLKSEKGDSNGNK